MYTHYAQQKNKQLPAIVRYVFNQNYSLTLRIPNFSEFSSKLTNKPGSHISLGVEGGKPGNPEKNPRSKAITNKLNHKEHRAGIEPGQIGGRRAFSPLRHP